MSYFLILESMSKGPECVCKGIRYCALCENLEETKIRRQKFKKNPDRETVIQQYDFDKPQIGGILVMDNFITPEEENIISERMNKVWFAISNKGYFFRKKAFLSAISWQLRELSLKHLTTIGAH